MKIKIKRIENGILPEYKTAGAAGADCYARIEKEIILNENDMITVPLGFAVEIPDGYEMQIRPRSGLARKNKTVAVLGTIDSDYRGEVAAFIINHSKSTFTIEPNDRIAQAVVCPVIRAEWELTDELSETERGKGGFGSTGVSENKEIEMSYPHNVKKFYEPFRTIDDADKFIAKEVIIDGKYKAVVESIFFKDTTIGRRPFISFRYVENGKEIIIRDNMDFVTAFSRVVIDGHRFGRELEIEND